MITRPTHLRPVVRWPFYLGDAIFLAMAGVSLIAGGNPPSAANILIASVCALIAVGLFLAPFLIDNESKVRIAQQSAKDSVDAQARRLAAVAEQLANAISRSQATEEQAGRALAGLEELSDKLVAQIDDLTQAASRERPAAVDPAVEAITQLVKGHDQRIDSLASKIGGVEKALVELAKRTFAAESKTTADPAQDRPVRPQPEPVAAAESLAPPSSTNDGKPAASPQPRTPKKTPLRSHPPPPQGELAFSGAEQKPKRAANATNDSTALVATAYIGIGNKLFLRGDGPGLSWEKGVPMEFLAIGKWGWKTVEATAPVSCTIYRNDDTPMLNDSVIIDPGARVEIAPRF